MIVIGADTHKRSHTIAAVNAAAGRAIGDRAMPATHHAFEDALMWARGRYACSSTTANASSANGRR
jgi:hypothetical protein